jgi:hypothetical protein
LKTVHHSEELLSKPIVDAWKDKKNITLF